MWALLMLVIFCATPSVACAKNSQSNQPAEWSLSLTSGGAPWDKKFKVELNQAGVLSVTGEDPPKLPNNPTTKLTIKLSSNDVQEIYEQALLAVQPVPGAQKKNEIADGTRINLELVMPGRKLARGYHVGLVEEEAPAVAKLFGLMNKHIPKEHHIY